MRPLTNDQRHYLYATLSMLEEMKNELQEDVFYSQYDKVFDYFEKSIDIIEAIINYDLSLRRKSDKERLLHDTLSRLYN